MDLHIWDDCSASNTQVAGTKSHPRAMKEKLSSEITERGKGSSPTSNLPMSGMVPASRAPLATVMRRLLTVLSQAEEKYGMEAGEIMKWKI